MCAAETSIQLAEEDREAARHPQGTCLAARRVWWPATDCIPGQVCAAPRIRKVYQWAFVAVTALVLIAFGFPVVAPWFY